MLQRFWVASLAIMLATSAHAEGGDPAIDKLKKSAPAPAPTSGTGDDTEASAAAPEVIDITPTLRGKGTVITGKAGKTKEVEVPVYQTVPMIRDPDEVLTVDYPLYQSGVDNRPLNMTYEEIVGKILGFMEQRHLESRMVEVQFHSSADTTQFRGRTKAESDLDNQTLANMRGNDLRQKVYEGTGIPFSNLHVLPSTELEVRQTEIRLFEELVREDRYAGSPEQEIPTVEPKAPMTIFGAPLRMVLGAQTRVGNLTLERSTIMDIEGVGGLRLESDPWFLETRGILGYRDERAWGFDLLFGRALHKRVSLALGGGTWKWGRFSDRRVEPNGEVVEHHYLSQNPSVYGLLELQILVVKELRATLGGALGPWEAPAADGGVAEYTPVIGWVGVSYVGFPF